MCMLLIVVSWSPPVTPPLCNADFLLAMASSTCDPVPCDPVLSLTRVSALHNGGVQGGELDFKLTGLNCHGDIFLD